MTATSPALSSQRDVPTPYDFRRPLKVSREHARMLQIAFETFARQSTTVLTSSLRSVCQVNLLSVQQQSYGEYVESIGETTYMTVFSVEPVKQPAVLEMPLAATMMCVDRLLGGPGSTTQPERPLTEFESSVVQGLFERLLAEVRYSFASVVPLSPAVVGVEYSPQLAQLAAATELMVVARFELRRGEAVYAWSLCLSFAGLLPHLTGPGVVGHSGADPAQRAEASRRLSASFQEVPVEVAAQLRPTTVDPAELVGLSVGDVVRLDHPAQAPLDVMAADVLFAHATLGRQGKRLACLVVAPPLEESS